MKRHAVHTRQVPMLSGIGRAIPIRTHAFYFETSIRPYPTSLGSQREAQLAYVLQARQIMVKRSQFQGGGRESMEDTYSRGIGSTVACHQN